MKIVTLVMLSLFITGCVSVNTKESLIASGKKSQEMFTDIPMTQMESNVEAYLNKCYKSSMVNINTNSFGEILNVYKSKTEKGTQLTVTKYLNSGDAHLLLVSLEPSEVKNRTKIIAYAYDFTRAASFEKLSELANGKAPGCPYSL